MSFTTNSLPVPNHDLLFSGSVLLDAQVSDALTFTDTTEPSTVATGNGKLYKKEGDDGLFWKPDTGVVVDLTSGGGSGGSDTLDTAYDNSGGAALINVNAGDITWAATGGYSVIHTADGVGSLTFTTQTGDITASSAGGDVKLSTVDSGIIDISSTDGALNIGTSGAGPLNIDTSNASLTIGTNTNPLSIASTQGDITVSTGFAGAMALSTVTGDMTLTADAVELIKLDGTTNNLYLGDVSTSYVNIDTATTTIGVNALTPTDDFQINKAGVGSIVMSVNNDSGVTAYDTELALNKTGVGDGDPVLHYTTDAGDWVVGVDNSDSNTLKIQPVAALSSVADTVGMAIDAAGIVTLGGVTGAMRLHNLTTSERDALTGAEGMIIYNETTFGVEGYQNGVWSGLGSSLTLIAAPITADPAPAVVNTHYRVDTTLAAFVFTLPQAPADGDVIVIEDSVGNCSTNAVTVTPTVDTLEGGTTYDLGVNFGVLSIKYYALGADWIVQSYTTGGGSTLSDAYVASAGASAIDVDAGDLSWDATSTYNISTTTVDGTLFMNSTGIGQVDISTDSGDMNSTTGTGDMNLTTGSGAMSIFSSTGTISIESTTADVLVKSTSGNATVETTAGALSLTTSFGDVTLGSSTGSLVMTTSSGELSMSTTNAMVIESTDTNGSISIATASATLGDINIATNNGPISIQSALGEVNVTAGTNMTLSTANAIDIEAISGDVAISTVNGNMGVSAPLGTMDITAGTDTTITSTNNVTVGSASGILSMYATTGNVSLATQSSGNVVIDSAVDITLDTTSGVMSLDTTSGAFNATTTSGDMTLTTGAGILNMYTSNGGAMNIGTASGGELNIATTGVGKMVLTTETGAIAVVADGTDIIAIPGNYQCIIGTDNVCVNVDIANSLFRVGPSKATAATIDFEFQKDTATPIEMIIENINVSASADTRLRAKASNAAADAYATYSADTVHWSTGIDGGLSEYVIALGEDLSSGTQVASATTTLWTQYADTLMSHNSDTTAGAITTFQKARVTTSTAVNDLDSLGAIVFNGNDNVDYYTGAEIESRATNTWNVGLHGTELVFRVTGFNTDTLIDKVQIGDQAIIRDTCVNYQTSNSSLSVVSVDDAINQGSPAILQFIISNSTDEGTLAQVISGDIIGEIQYAGATDSGFGTGAKIKATATEDWTSASHATQLSLWSASVGESDISEKLIIDDNVVVFNGQLVINSSASDPALPVDSMIYHDTDMNKLRFYNGSSWEQLWSYDPVNSTGSVTAVAFDTYRMDSVTTNITLPTSPNDGDRIVFIDSGGNSSTVNKTLTPNGADTINGDLLYTMNVNGGAWVIEYDLSTTNWVLISRTDGGDVVGYTRQQYFKEATLTDGTANPTWNLDIAQTAVINITVDVTGLAITNYNAGATYMLRVVEDGIHEITWPSASPVVMWPGGIAPTFTNVVGQVNIVSFICDGTNMYGIASLAFA
jgi:hypothetical protein